MQFAIESLFRGFVLGNAALGKLPRVLSHPACPQHLALSIRQYDPDVWPESVLIYHVAVFRICLSVINTLVRAAAQLRNRATDSRQMPMAPLYYRHIHLIFLSF